MHVHAGGGLPRLRHVHLHGHRPRRPLRHGDGDDQRQPGQRRPGGVGRRRTTLEDTAVAVAVLGNDSDVDGDVLTVVALGAPSAGSAAIVGGNVVYTPAADFHGTD